MPDPSSIEVIRAVVETLVPETDGRPGAVELGVERHVTEEVEGFMEGLVDFLATLVNAYASGVRPGATFTELSPEERGRVIREMSAEESQEIREAITTIYVFALGGTFSEWAELDPEHQELRRRPAAWDDVGYAGPSLGYPEYRSGV